MRIHEVHTLKELEELISKETYHSVSSEHSMSNQVIKEHISDITKDMVYERYTPTRYERRGDDGGLSDIDNLVTSPEGKIGDAKYSISFVQEVEGNFDDDEFTDDLATTINEGWGDKEAPYEQPSRHIDYLNENLVEELRGEIVNAIKFDLYSKGYKIE